ncbi:MAG: hypothetical protein R6V85_15920 [Polyangia bacterium]
MMDATARKEKLEELLQRVQCNRERLSAGSSGAVRQPISLPTPSEPPPSEPPPEPLEIEPVEPAPPRTQPAEPAPVEPPPAATRRVEPSLSASRPIAEVGGEQAEQWTIRAVLRRARRLGASGD